MPIWLRRDRASKKLTISTAIYLITKINLTQVTGENGVQIASATPTRKAKKQRRGENDGRRITEEKLPCPYHYVLPNATTLVILAMSMKSTWQKDESVRNFIRDDKRMIFFLGLTNDNNLQQI